MANIFKINRTANSITLGTTDTLIEMTGRSTLTGICTVAAGLSFQRVTGLQTGTTAMTGTLRGAYIDVSNGILAATGTIRGMELKARTEAPGDTGNDVAVLEGLSISADSKGHSVTTMRAAEFILDGSAGGTITEAVGLRIANNLQANKATTSYGLQIYHDSFDYTADIQLSSGGLIGGSGGDLFITDAGNVSIGTMNPEAPFHVVGGGAPNKNPTVILENLTSQSWCRTLSVFTPNISNGEISGLITFGRADEVREAGHMYFVNSAVSGEEYIGFGVRSNSSNTLVITGNGKVGISDTAPGSKFDVNGDINTTDVYKVDDIQVISNRVIDARCDDTIDSGDATTDGVIDALRDAMITHGLITAT